MLFRSHDNPTTRAWYEDLPDDQRQFMWDYLKCPMGESGEVAWELIRLAWSSEAALAIAPLQDVLNLGRDALMTVPGQAEGNWRWRCTDEMLSAPAFQRLRDMTNKSTRSSVL